MNQEIEKLIPVELYKNNYNKFDVLGLSVDLTNKYEFHKAFKLRNIAEQMDINDTINNGYQDETFNLLDQSVITHIFYNKISYNEEYTLYDPIKRYINDLIENAEIVEHEILNNKIPDIFLSVKIKFPIKTFFTAISKCSFFTISSMVAPVLFTSSSKILKYA